MKKLLVCIFTALMLVGCTLESEFGLPNDEKINKSLLGRWGNKKESQSYMEFVKRTDYTYTLRLIDGDSIEDMQAYTKKIKGRHILTLINKENNHSFYGYKVNARTFTYYEVNDSLPNGKLESAAQLLNHFEKHVNKKGFFKKVDKLDRL